MVLALIHGGTSHIVEWAFPRLTYTIRSPFLRFLNYGHLWYPHISQDGLQPRKMRKQTISRLVSARRSFASAARKEIHAFACRIENKPFPILKRVVRVLVMHPSSWSTIRIRLDETRDCCSALNSRIRLGCRQENKMCLRSHDREWQTLSKPHLNQISVNWSSKLKTFKIFRQLVL